MCLYLYSCLVHSLEKLLGIIARLSIDCLTFKTILLDLKRDQTNHRKN